MERANLVSKLKAVSPALANNSIIPIMCNFWFTGDDVMAYNDKIAISVPCEAEVSGAVPPQLLSLLLTSSAEKVSMSTDGKEMVAKAAKATFRLSVIPKTDFIFEMPKAASSAVTVSKALLKAFSHCLRSIAPDSVNIQQMGVTLVRGDKGLWLYATNAVTITKAYVKWDGPKLDRVVLPGLFCQTLLDIAKDPAKLVVAKDHVLATTSKNTQLFGRLLVPEKYLNFDEVIQHHYSGKQEKQAITVTKKQRGILTRILERACITADIDTQKMFTTVSVSDGEVTFHTKAGPVEVTDKLQLDTHPDVKEVRLEPALLKAGLSCWDDSETDKILFSDTCAVMSGKDVIYLIGSTSRTD